MTVFSILEEGCFRYDEGNVCFDFSKALLPLYAKLSSFCCLKYTSPIMTKITVFSILEEGCFHYDENSVYFDFRKLSLPLYTKLFSFLCLKYAASTMTKTAFLVLKAGLLLLKPKLR